MVFNIILNSSNVGNANNTFYEKNFIGGSFTIPAGSEMCISQIVIPYSWFNISAGYNNNKLSYIWNGYYPSVIWNGTMSSSTFTGTADSGSNGSFVVGQMVVGTNLASNTVVSSTGTGTVTLSNTYSGTAPTVITGIPTFTGYIQMNGTNALLILSSTVTGTFALNTVLYSSNTGLASNVYIVSQYSGTLGATNSVYLLSSSQTVAVGSSGSPFKFGFVGTYNTITFTDGFYEVTDMNNYIQTYMISQNQYIYDSTLLVNQYFIYLYSNTTYYANQFVLAPIAQSFLAYTTANSADSYTLPTGFAFSAFGNVPQIVVYNGIVNYLGLLSGTYPTLATTLSSSVISNTTPVGSTVNSIMLRCNLIRNDATVPTDILDTFYPNTTFGSNIVYQPPYEKWISMVEGSHSSLFLNFQDQDGNQIYARDNNVMISLLIRLGEVYLPLPPPIIDDTPIKVQVINPINFKE